MRDPTTFQQLPEELKLTIFEYLDSRPPSETQSRKEPKLTLSRSDTHPYKSASLVCGEWRRISLPLLFRNLRLNLSVAPRDHWKKCPVCKQPEDGTDSVISVDSDQDASTLATYHHRLHDGISRSGVSAFSGKEHDTYSLGTAREALIWPDHAYHCLQDLLDFVVPQKLEVESIVVLSDRQLQRNGRDTHAFPDQQLFEHRVCAIAVSEMWQLLLAHITPRTLTVVAPPVDLALLGGCTIYNRDAWAFSDMEYHILQLHVDEQALPPPSEWRAQEELDLPHTWPRQTIEGHHHDLLDLRPWTHVSLNEGSFLKSYSSYHHFEREPPSILNALKEKISRSHSPHPNADAPTPSALHALKSLTYTAILPFQTHADFADIAPFIVELNLQLAPAPAELHILDLKDRVGKAELADCWQELFAAYSATLSAFSTAAVLARESESPVRTRKFVCMDKRIPMLEDDLDYEFVRLCLPSWAEMEPGVFIRIQADPPEAMYRRQ